MDKERSILLIVVLLLFGCVNSSGAGNSEITTNTETISSSPVSDETSNRDKGDKRSATFIRCTDPRPEICTMDYSPVCGKRDPASNCDNEPCSSSEWKTYSNGCSACSNADVAGYSPGECNQSD